MYTRHETADLNTAAHAACAKGRKGKANGMEKKACDSAWQRLGIGQNPNVGRTVRKFM